MCTSEGPAGRPVKGDEIRTCQLEEVPLSILDGWMEGSPTSREAQKSMEGINFRKRNNLTLEWPDFQLIGHYDAAERYSWRSVSRKPRVECSVASISRSAGHGKKQQLLCSTINCVLDIDRRDAHCASGQHILLLACMNRAGRFAQHPGYCKERWRINLYLSPRTPSA